MPEDNQLEHRRSGGWCARCGLFHHLPAVPVLDDCRALMAHFEASGRIDGLEPGTDAHPGCTTAPLFATGGGKMFGILACRDAVGKRVLLRAFSGQFNGLWQVPGWVGPIFDEARFSALVDAPDRQIKALGSELEGLEPHTSRYRLVRRQRRQLSQQLMRAIHDLYRLTNFRGNTAPLMDVFLGKGIPPAGTGDCCGPKLVHQAALNGLRPEAMAEFYWGAANNSGTKQHGQWYPACAAKCQPILGFQLCGL
ncbi:MAG: hypothetical protein PHI97_11725 [Desulfobulbus sp.]|nr:hypothetical protein [Desulfobulbus sp.]